MTISDCRKAICAAKWLQLEATLETTASGQEPVKLETTSSLELHVGLQVEFEKEIL
ncbi:MAG: hypothetical protein QNL67_00065 [Cryomorphaceae bacterium]|jgi:hypothetical protein